MLRQILLTLMKLIDELRESCHGLIHTLRESRHGMHQTLHLMAEILMLAAGRVWWLRIRICSD